MRNAFLVMLVSLSTVSAEFSLGVNMSLTAGQNRQGEFEVVPTLVFHPTSTFEIDPRFGFNVNRDGSDFGLVAGCGFFWHVVESDLYSLSLGPDLGTRFGFGDHSLAGFAVGMPVNLDLGLTDNFFIRLSVSVVSVGFNTNAGDRLHDDAMGISIATVQPPSMGFFFTF